MSKPTYWACTDCMENCLLIRDGEADDPEACVEDEDDVSWTSITRDEFLRRDNLLNDPSHIAQYLPKLKPRSDGASKEIFKTLYGGVFQGGEFASSNIVQSTDKTPGLWRKDEEIKKEDSEIEWKSDLLDHLSVGIDPAASKEDQEGQACTSIEELQPKFKVGDRVIITERILYWIEKFHWSSDMMPYLGQTITLDHRTLVERHEKETGYPCWTSVETCYSWPEDCLEKV